MAKTTISRQWLGDHLCEFDLVTAELQSSLKVSDDTVTKAPHQAYLQSSTKEVGGLNIVFEQSLTTTRQQDQGYLPGDESHAFVGDGSPEEGKTLLRDLLMFAK